MGWINYKLDHWASQFITCYWSMSVCNTMTIAVRTSHKTLRRRGILLLAGCSSHLVKHVYIHGSWTTKANYNGCQVGSRREEAGCGIATPAPGHSVGGSWSESTSRWRSLLNVATLGYITFLTFPMSLVHLPLWMFCSAHIQQTLHSQMCDQHHHQTTCKERESRRLTADYSCVSWKLYSC